MNPDLEQAVTVDWSAVLRLLAAPLTWLTPISRSLWHWVLSAEGWEAALVKWLFLLLPAASVIAGLWCTALSVYTLPFRSGRGRFVSTLLVLWWDVARSAWLFWTGTARFLWVFCGAFFNMIHLLVRVCFELLHETFELPFALTGTITRNLRQPGVPWLAFLMTLGWAFIEALVFTYVLHPTVSELMADITGADPSRFLSPVLFIMLFVMVAGSLACMHVLVEAMASKDYSKIAQMLIVEGVVMFVEVTFLYRELVDMLTPWIAQQTQIEMGLAPVLALSTTSWLGVRAMVWFLFARYGTPMMLAMISRQRLQEEAEAESKASAVVAEERWQRAMGLIKRDQAWFEEKANMLVEAAVLPAFQVVASALNFPLVLVVSRPLFSLPFKSLAEVGETRALLKAASALESDAGRP